MAHHDEAGDPAAALENLDEALSTAVEQLALYLDLTHESDERSRPADLLAAVLHRYAQQHHRKAHLAQLPLADIIDEVVEAREDSDLRRAEYREEYGESAGDLLASLTDATHPIPPRWEDLCDADEAVRRYRYSVDHYIGEGAGLPRQKVARNAEMRARYWRALQEAIGLYMREPEHYSIVWEPSSIDKMNVFEAVAPKYNIESPATLYNQYGKLISAKERAQIADFARKKKQRLQR